MAQLVPLNEDVARKSQHSPEDSARLGRVALVCVRSSLLPSYLAFKRRNK